MEKHIAKRIGQQVAFKSAFIGIFLKAPYFGRFTRIEVLKRERNMYSLGVKYGLTFLIAKSKSILLFIVLIAATQNANAQYSIDKEKYDFRDYEFRESDRYNPTIATVAALVVPGLGHFYCKENQRGLRIIGIFGGGMVVTMSGLVVEVLTNMDGSRKGFTVGQGLIAAGLLTSVGVYVWSPIDAAHVAKVKNLALRDKQGTSFTIGLAPQNINPTSQTIGLSLKVNF